MRSKTTMIAGGMVSIGLAVLCMAFLGGKSREAAPWWESGAANTSAATETTAASLTGVFGPGADVSWTVMQGKYQINRESSLPFPAETPGSTPVLTVTAGQPLVLDGRTRYPGGIEVKAMVRFGAAGYADLLLSQHQGPPDPNDVNKRPTDCSLRYLIYGDPTAGSVRASVGQNGKTLHDLAALLAKSDWGDVPLANDFAYEPRAYTRFLPGWPEDWRARVEHDMASIPALADKWLSLRIELKKGFARFWLDDHVVAWKQDDTLDVEGTMRLSFYPGLQIAGFTVSPLVETPGFQTIPLGGYVQGRAFAGDRALDAGSLPAPDEVVTVEGVPFVFPGVHDGCDHLDISRSYLREGNYIGYSPTTPYRYVGSTKRDPARIQVRIPNAPYDTLYLVAAAEEKADTVPLVTAMFFRPGAGFADNYEVKVPFATAKSGAADAKPLSVKLANGRTANLWLIKVPLDPGRLSSFSDMDIVEIEFAKQVQLYRSYPDPISYAWHPAGLPSSVHVYAATLAVAPVAFTWDPNVFGHVWQAPAQPAYTATVINQTAGALTGKVAVIARSYDGTDEIRQEQKVVLPAPPRGKPGAPVKLGFGVAAKLHGYYDITATLEIAGKTWTEKRSFVRLAPDTRTAKWTGKGGLFNYWSYAGGHHTPNNPQIVRLMMMAGARPEPPTMGNPWFVTAQPWATEEKPDPAKVAAFQKEIVKKVEDWQAQGAIYRGADDLYCFPEPGISARLSSGNYPEYWNGVPYVYTDEEKQNLKTYFESARIAAQTYRTAFPNRKILIPWGDPLFVVPLLRAGFPKDLIDGSALDIPGFERIPERQLHEQSIHRLYELKKEFEKAGIPHPRLQYNEGIFVPTEPGAVDYREQMDIYHRWTLISMAYGVTRFHSGWFAFDCGNYYGAEHYGGCGIQRRIPYCDPKPAYAAYATMTDKLNDADFDGWLATGSMSTYALRFKHETRGNIYALWTLRGKRPVTIELAADGKVLVTDSMNNTRELATKDKQVTVTTDPSVIYVTFPAAGPQIAAIRVGDPDHADAQPAKDAVLLGNLGDGSWKFTNERDGILESNHWAMMHYPGKFTATVADDPKQGKVLVSKLEKQDQVHELMPWYNVLRPAKPISLTGAPAKLGLWVKGASDWGRFIYVLRDAKGERWISIGTKDQYNCDDVHSWSQFCFDGWRYLSFELPGHTGWDSFRKAGTTWWRGGVGGKEADFDVVDLPVTLEAIIVEQRSHILYVNDVQPNPSDRVAFGKLYVEYETPSDAAAEAVRQNRLRMPVPTGMPELPNPIANLTRDGVGEPVRIAKLTPPTHEYDGTRMHVQFETNPAAKSYHLWVGAHADGRGAVDLTPSGVKPGDLVTGLRPGIRLYYWVVYADEKGKMSKPSPVHEEVTVDNFKEK